MDLDSTVVTVYGKQEGAAVGYNPRPSYRYHTYMMGQLRLPIDGEALPGNHSHGSPGADALWHLVDHHLSAEAHPWCIRGVFRMALKRIYLAASREKKTTCSKSSKAKEFRRFAMMSACR